MEVRKKARIFLAILMVLLVFVACNKNQAGEVENQEKVESAETSKAQDADAKEEDFQLKDVSFLAEYTIEKISPEFNKEGVDAKVKDYSIEGDLSNVENISHFGNFTEEQKAALVNNGFVITKTGLSEFEWEGKTNKEFRFDQIHQIYDENDYKGIPSFVTTDSVTHAFHIFYDNFLRSVEKNHLYPKAQELTKGLYKSNLEIYKELTNENIKEAQGKNLSYLVVAGRLLGLDFEDIPKELDEIVNGEMENVTNKIPATSFITGKNVDYSQLTTRGHYTRGEELERYFQATMYYGQVGFFSLDDMGEIDKEALVQSLLLTHSLYKDQALFKLWADMVDPVDFLVETADDLSIREYAKILYGVYGRDFDINNLDSEKELTVVASLIKKEPAPKIAGFLGQSFRLIPQRAVMDNVLMQNVVDVINLEPSKRPIYSGLDLLAAFGNEKAKEIQYADDYNSYWDEYKERTEKNIKIVYGLNEKDWQKNLYRGWLWMLESYKNTFGKGYPKFMRNEAWQKKDLVSALGSYAELKHDTVLYGKAVMAEAGGGGFTEYPKSYVEPNVELYNRLNWLLNYAKVNLEAREMLSSDEASKLENFANLVSRLIDLSKKELENIPFTEDENIFLYYFGGELEAIMLDFLEEDENGYSISGWYEIENPVDRRMPVVVDLMRVVENVCGLPEGKIAQIATGKPQEIYVIYPHQGKLYMGRGGVFSYYEFLSDERMTDEKWQETLLNKEEPEIPKWYQDIIHGEKEEFEGNVDIYW